MKYSDMGESVSAYFRGTAPLFHAALPRDAAMRRAPVVWACGDLHLANFGAYKGENRLTYFDINDFDEGALAPVTAEIARFLASILAAAGDLELSAPDARSLCGLFLERYGRELRSGKARWVERQTSQGMIRDLFDAVTERPRRAFVDERTLNRNGRLGLRLGGRRAMPIPDAERAAIEAFMAAYAKRQPRPEFFRLLDCARRGTGLASLGLRRYVLLVHGRGGEGGSYLLDLKQSARSSLAVLHPRLQPAWKSDAERIVAVQARMQAIEPALLAAVAMRGLPFVLRELQPTEDRIEPARYSGKPRRLGTVVETMAEVVAWAQLRSSGRGGSSSADELADFVQDADWRRRTLALAREAAAAVRRDWKAFGRLDPGELAG